MKKRRLGLLVLSLLLTGCSETTLNTSYDVNKYYEYVDRCARAGKQFMPVLGSFSDYNDISVSLTTSSHSLGHKDTIPYGLMLFVSYDVDIFEVKKEEVNQNYSFVEEPIIDNDDDILMPAIDVLFYGYRIRVVKNEQFYYPKNFGMIGINEDTQTIAYMYYEENDIDLLATVGDSIEKQEHSFIYLISQTFVFPE